MKTDNDLQPFVDRRVRLTFEDGRYGQGKLWRDRDGGRWTYELAPSNPSEVGFIAHGERFSAEDVADIESF